MVDCSQLQALLDEAQQERQAMNLKSYCQDQCDPGDVTCIKQCEMSLPERKRELDQEIADIENEMGLCGTWSLVVQAVVEATDHWQGSLAITGILAGTITLSDQPGNTLFSGTYNPEQGTIELLRPIHDVCESVQHYKGSVHLSTQPPTMQGQMRIEYGRHDCLGFDPVYDWSAQKQS